MTANATNTTNNMAEDDHVNFYNIFNSIMTIAILSINSLVLVLIFLKRRILLKSTSNKVILSLVVSDLLSGFLMVLHFVTSLSKSLGEPTTQYAFYYRVFLDIASTWIQLVTMGNLSLIITERYITLIFPYKIDRLINKQRVLIAILIIWILALLIPSIQLFWVYKVFDGELTEEEDIAILNADSKLSTVIIIILVILPITVLFFIFVHMFHEIRNFPTIDLVTKQREQKRVLIIFAVMFLLFAIFSLPYFSIRLLIDIKYTVPLEAFYIANVLKHLPPLINPFVYVLNKPDFKRELRNSREALSKFLTKTSVQRSLSHTSRRPSNDPSIQKLMLKETNNNNETNSQETMIKVQPAIRLITSNYV